MALPQASSAPTTSNIFNSSYISEAWPLKKTLKVSFHPSFSLVEIMSFKLEGVPELFMASLFELRAYFLISFGSLTSTLS